MTYTITTTETTLLLIGIVWELTWKGLGMWKAARNDHKGWYTAILVLNTVGILPIIYLLTHMTHPETNQKGVNHEKVVSVQG